MTGGCPFAHLAVNSMAMLKASAKTKPQPSLTGASKGKRNARDPFWRRPFRPELDRAGNFILRNLEVMREEAIARGDSR